MIVLFWLTATTPFIITMQEDLAKQQKAQSVENPFSNSEEDGTDSNSNNIEEKVPNSGNSLSEEFLHEHCAMENCIYKATPNYWVKNAGTYIAFHGELHAPPPNVA